MTKSVERKKLAHAVKESSYQLRGGITLVH